MLSEKLEKALNQQLHREFESFYLYLGMASYFEKENLKGFAHWMNAQAREEMEHAMKFYGFIFEMGGAVELEALSKPKNAWDSPVKAFEEAYEHEQFITRNIHELMDLAVSEKNYAVQNFLSWFITEQVEEENSAEEIVQKLKLLGNTPQGLYLLNRELFQRQG